MRYSVITESSPQRLTDAEGAGLYVKVPALFAKMREAGWIKPVVQRPRMTLFDLNQLDQCVERLASGDFPE
jgi:hypothetical protein